MRNVWILCVAGLVSLGFGQINSVKIELLSVDCNNIVEIKVINTTDEIITFSSWPFDGIISLNTSEGKVEACKLIEAVAPTREDIVELYPETELLFYIHLFERYCLKSSTEYLVQLHYENTKRKRRNTFVGKVLSNMLKFTTCEQ